MLQLESLRETVPAIFASKPAGKVSEKYQFVPTKEVLEVLQDHGWGIVGAKQQKSFKSNPETNKHTILLRRNGGGQVDIRHRYPTLRVINSHDWSSRLAILFGMLELVCSNGLFFAGPDFEAYNVRHDQVNEDILTILNRFNSAEQRMDSIVKTFQGVKLSDLAIQDLSMQAARLRFGENADETVARNLTYSRYFSQDQNDLWSIFNTIQGNVIGGGVRVNRRRSRSIGNIDAERRLNEELFKLASSFVPQVSL